MSRIILSILATIILIYISFSLLIQDKSIVGIVGYYSAKYLIKYFGYLIFIYVFGFLYFIYKLNFSYIENLKYKLLLHFYLFLNLLIFQSLIIKSMPGIMGKNIILALKDYIGIAGIWIIVIVGILVSFYALFDDKFLKVKEFFINLKPKTKNQKLKTKIKSKIKKEDNVIVKEVGDTAEIILEQEIKQDLDNFSKRDALKEIEEFENKTKLLNQKVNNEIEFEQKEEVDEVKDKKINVNIVEELEENKKLLSEIELGKSEKPKDYTLPPTNFFQKPPKKKSKTDEALIDKKIKDLLEKLAQFRIEGDVIRTYTGPLVTTFEFKPAPNVKISKILNLQDDLAMALKAQTIRIQAPIPGKDVVGIEVPNDENEIIYIRELLESELFQNAKSPLTLILGKDIVGKPFVTDLKKLPHLLIAGTTGSGKSVGINAMLISLLYKNSPDNLKLIMIDPKMLEFSIYNDIPHLLTPVITKPTEAINALSNMVKEMEKRYARMAETKTKNIENYNEKAKKEGFEPFPYIVVIIDELADLMMTSGKDVELSIARLAQMARASGIHLIVATQRPSVDVVTGLIKANLPSRISFKVGQKVDSKIILDSLGAESLLGRGDMLFTPPGISGLVRIHAPWSSESEIEKVVEFIKEQKEVEYDMSFVKENSGINEDSNVNVGELDELYEQAKMVVLQDKKSSISYLQRRLKIGYNRAASIIEQLEQTGVLSAPNAKGNREILINN